MEKESLLRFATALSALAVTQVGVGLGDWEQLNTLQQQIQVSALHPTMGA
ncbi:1-phosphofructokinase [Vibrio cholerae]|nr:1-phosphofructokinase [Vibrio cholerae]